MASAQFRDATILDGEYLATLRGVFRGDRSLLRIPFTRAPAVFGTGMSTDTRPWWRVARE